jgi:hypothetical protein
MCVPTIDTVSAAQNRRNALVNSPPWATSLHCWPVLRHRRCSSGVERHTRDRDTSTDRQRNEVAGMRDTSGSIKDCHLLLRDLKAYKFE